MSEPIVLTKHLGGSELTRAALAGAVPASWYAVRPASARAWSNHAAGVRAEGAAREWLTRLQPALEPEGAARERLERSAGGKGIVVTTGQQPGLFGGPIYTWAKALSALAFADAIEAATGLPTAPVFWAATYDADFAEAATSYVNMGARVIELSLSPPDPVGRSMRDTPLGDVAASFQLLVEASGAAASRPVLDLVRTAYAPKATVGDAYVALLRAMLQPLGVAVLDGGHPAVLELARPILGRALRDAQTLDAALAKREREITAAGFAPAVAHVPGLSLVFDADGKGRRRVPIAKVDGDIRGALEPNVLLRPIVERVMLPTVAYVAGPAELAYFAQTSAVAEALGVPAPMVVPRWSGVIVEPSVQRILSRYGLEVDDLQDPHAAETRLARARLTPDVATALLALRQRVDSGIADVNRAAAAVTPPLLDHAVVEGARRSLSHRIDRLERRALAAVKRREEQLRLEIASAHASLFPLGRPQDRVLNIIPFLARYGDELLAAMRRRAEEHAATLVERAPTTVGPT